jgi:sugar phosphate isomerase/epimerase
MWKIGACTLPFEKKTFHEGLHFASKNGFEALEVIFEFHKSYPNLVKMNEMTRLKRDAKKYGIILTAHAPYIESVIKLNPAMMHVIQHEIEMTMKLCKAGGIDILTVHFPHEGGFRAVKKDFDRLRKIKMKEYVKMAEKYGVILALENMDSSVEAMKKLLTSVKSDNLAFTFDVSHWNIPKGEEKDHYSLFLKSFKDKLVKVHISDNAGKDNHWALGTGTINWQDFFICLKKIKFNKTVIIENTSEGDLLASKEYYDRLLKQIR